MANLAITAAAIDEALGYANSGTAKAWNYFNGTGVVAIRESYNIALLTDNGTGNYTSTLTSAMATTSFGIGGTGTNFTQDYRVVTTPTTTDIFHRIISLSSGNPTDDSRSTVSIFGNLA